MERPRPDEVRALFRQGTGRALELFRLRGKRPEAQPSDPGQTGRLTRRARRSPDRVAKMTIATSRRVG